MICKTCGLPRVTKQERLEAPDRARRAVSFARLTGTGPDGMMAALVLAGARPRCWQSSDEACADWRRWEAEDAAEDAALAAGGEG